jgi:peroxiredoxin
MKARALLFSLLIGIFCLSAPHSMAGMGGEKLLEPGVAAPEFSFTDIEGKADSTKNFAKGEPLLLVFLQTTCRSCQRELEHMRDLGQGGFKVPVLAIFIDPTPREFKKFVEDNKLPFRFTWDEEMSIVEAYGVSFAPTSFLLDKDRKIAKVYRGWQGKGPDIEGDVKALNAN